MKRCMALFLVLLFLPVLSGRASALETASDSVLGEQASLYGIDDLETYLPEEANDIWGDLTVERAMQPQGLTEDLWQFLKQEGGQVLRNALQNVLMILLLCIIISFAQSFPMLAAHGQAAEITGALAVAMLGLTHACACIPEGVRIADALSTFTARLLPTVCAAAAASGAISAAGAKYLLASAALDLYGTVAKELLLPALYLYAAAAVSGSLFQNEILISVSAFLKRVTRLLLICTALGFTAFLTLTGALNGAADAAASKAAKTAISTALPVVGGILADAAESIAAGARMLSAGAGIIGILCAAAICVLPYMTFGIHYLLFQLVSEFSSSISGKRVSGLLRCFSDLYGMLLGIVGTLAFIVFASIISLMRATGAG